MSKLVVLFSLFLVTNAYAGLVVHDPKGVLKVLSAKIGKPSFDQLYRQGQVATFDQYVESCDIQCSDSDENTLGGCMSMCKEVPQDLVKEVISVQDGKAVVTSSLGDYQEITAEQIQACEGNLMVPFLNNLGAMLNLNGTLTLTKLTEFDLKINQSSSQPKTIKAYSVWGQFLIEGLKTSFELKASISPEVSGVSQIVLFSALNQPWFKLKSVE